MMSDGSKASGKSLVDVYKQANSLVTEYLANPQTSPQGKAHATQSLEIIEKSLENFSLDQLAMSFNGGKDCHVMLILVLAQIYRHYGEHSLTRLRVVHIRIPDSFPLVDDFVNECAEEYHLDLVTDTQSMKNALGDYLIDNPTIKAIFVGIRRQDPYGEHLDYIQRTDHGWPDFMRVHPVLEWDYGDIWDFLRASNVNYCSLYDEGYTSLGGVTTTVRNPALKVDDQTYLPAYKLKDYTQERVGRFQRTTS